ncbi:pyocin knob domain-containing protein [Lentilactobacillus buchneri]|uniref:pyocin knob domain-containing protein n=1 Tax=Lentilactobacillus buchneri TaxID=1581 RepID=UPI0034E3F59F
MATPNVGILTNAGKNLIDQVNAGQTKITFSKIVFSSMNNNQLTDDQIKALTTVAPQEIVVNNPKVTLDNNTGETRIRATGNNEALTDGVYVKTYAVYAKDDSGNEILYGTTVSPNPNYLPEYDGVTPQAVTYSYKVNISNTSNITFTNSDDIYVSDTDLAEALQPYAKTVDVNQQLDKKVTDNGDNSIEINKQAVTPVRDNKNGSINFNSKDMTPADDSAVVHTTGDETIDGQKKFKTDPTDGAGNAYAKTVDVNQQLDKKVNIADMRKPASDVAGIEEVNAKQDKIGYTPADDSKVVHDNHDGTISANGASILPANENVIGRIDYEYKDMNDITMGWWYLNGWADVSGLANWGLPQGFYYIHCFKTHSYLTATIQIAYDVQQNNTYMRTMPAAHNATWTTWKLLADDSKVAHLSGANNFDTVPTVNNNPLLLASSLPSDLARTGSDQEFTGKNTFDTAPIDKTTGKPYITKDGVPSLPPDLARTGQAQTFTAAQTFSIAPTIKDASTDKGDNQAATMADLKSVENSAWRPVKLSSDAQNMNLSTAFYQKNDNTKKFTLIVMGDPMGKDSVFSTPKLFFTDPDIKAFIGSVSDATGEFNNDYGLANSLSIDLRVKGNSLMFTTEFWVDTVKDDITSFLSNHPHAILAWSGYQKFTGTYE